MIYNADARVDLLERIPGQQGTDFQGNGEAFMRTALNESAFSTLASVAGGTKPTTAFLLSKMDHLTVVSDLKADTKLGFSCKRPKRKWKQDDVHQTAYNDGSESVFVDNSDSLFQQQNVKRARRASRNRASKRSFNRAAGGQGR